MGEPIKSTWSYLVKNGVGKYLLRQVQKEAGSAVVEEILGNITAKLGRFTVERIVDMVVNTLN